MSILTLTVKTGPCQGQTFIIDKPGIYHIGRDFQADWSLQDDWRISPRHCLIEATDNDFFVQDMQSDFGTFLDTEKVIQPTPISDNDVLLLGYSAITAVIQHTGAPSSRLQTQIPGFTLVKELPFSHTSDGRHVYWAIPEGQSNLLILHFVPTYGLPLTQAKEVDRLLRESNILAQLAHHPGILSFRGQKLVDEAIWFATDFVNGDPFDQFIQSRQNLSVTEVLRIGLQAADILAHLHRANIIHRSLGIDSFLVSTDHKHQEHFLYLVDLASAKWYQHDILSSITTADGLGFRLNSFTAPETLLNYKKVTLQSDVYALGAILYYLFSGRFPYEVQLGEDMMMAILEAQTVPIATLRPDLPAQVVATIEKAMAVDPADRFSTAVEMHRALRQHLNELNEQSVAHVSQNELLQKIQPNFNISELKRLFLSLNIDYDELAGATKKEKVVELILYCQRYQRIHELVEYCEQERDIVFS